MANITDKQITDFYKEVKWGKAESAFKKVSKNEYEKYSLIKKLAKELDENSFLVAIKSNEYPAIKLTTKELELLKGGGLLLLAIAYGIFIGYQQEKAKHEP